MGVGLTNAQKETLRKLRACKEEKGVYPFVLRVNASGNYIELRIDGLEFAPNDINRLIDFDLLTRNGAEYRITTEGYQALENNFQLLPSVSEQLESRRRLLNQHQSNLLKLKENAAIYAAGEVPLHLTNQIEAEEKAIEEQEVAIAELESKKGND
jgi:hypothetical protein